MRTYDQYCGIAKALDVLGQRWTPLILRELLLGPRRYSELQRALPGITTNLLAARIRQMEADGLIHGMRRASDDRKAWALTELGQSVRPALLALGAFGARWMGDVGDDHVSGRWFVVSLQRRYRGGADGDYEVGLEIDGEPYHVHLSPDRLDARDGWPEDPDLVVRGGLAEVAAALVGERGRAPEGLQVVGDTRVLAALRDGIQRPATA